MSEELDYFWSGNSESWNIRSSTPIWLSLIKNAKCESEKYSDQQQTGPL